MAAAATIGTALNALVFIPEISATTDSASYEVNKTITVTITTPATATSALLKSEAGATLYTTSKSYVENDGIRVWTLTVALGTAGNRTLSVNVDGVDKTTVAFAVTKFVLSASAPSSVKPNALFTITVAVAADVSKVLIFSENGTQLSAIRSKVGTTFTFQTALGTLSPVRTITVKAYDSVGNVIGTKTVTFAVAR